MRHCLTLFAFFLLYTHPSQAQAPAYTIQGKIVDTANYLPTQYSSVALIRAADSILMSFTRAQEDGGFKLQTDSAGAYILMIAHPLFATSVSEVELRDSKTDLGEIPMIAKRQLLQEVIITDKKAIVIKGDTIEYNADSFLTAAYDNVDELLKKLPGIEVGGDGSIKAYGEKVQKMFVDGEEFFSDDPAVVAKTLRASAVDKVQVFDKKSEQAAFTGIDDGERIKSINLKLKENAKQGYFGKVGAGAGLPDYWNGSAMINAFKEKRKIAAYGLTSSTQTSGLGWDDSRQYGGGGGGVYIESDNGSMISTGGFDDGQHQGGEFRGQGVPTTWTGGAHYSNKWWDNDLSFSGNYSFRNHAVDSRSNSQTQYLLPDTQYITNDEFERRNVQRTHNFHSNTYWEIDSFSSIRMNVRAQHVVGNSSSKTGNQTATLSDVLLNENTSHREELSSNDRANADLFYRRKFKKKGRTMSFNWRGNWSQRESNGSMLSQYSLLTIDSIYSFNQTKVGHSKGVSNAMTLSYTEPLLADKIFLALHYSFNLSKESSENFSYDRDDEGNEVLNEVYSSSYVFNRHAHEGGAVLRFVFNDKTNLSLGGNINNTSFLQEDRMVDTAYRYSYLNFFPQLNFNYRPSQLSSYGFRYNGSTRQPTLSQLQPLRDNTNPLDVALGNPNLKQEFRHNFNFSYNDYNVMSSRNMFVNLYYMYVQNAISRREVIDAAGRRVCQYVNVSGNQNVGMFFNYGQPVYKKLRGNLNFNGSLNRDQQYINFEESISTYFSLSPSLSFRLNLDTTLALSYHFSPRYNQSITSIREDVPLHYWMFEQSFSGSYRFLHGFRLGTEVTWSLREKLNTTEKYNKILVWNAYLSKSFLKDKSLELRFYANDILNQNVGYTRWASTNQLINNNYNTIMRYFMLSLTWNFTKTGGGSEAGASSIQID